MAKKKEYGGTNQYSKEKNPNDYKKGNRTNSKRADNVSLMVNFNSEEIARYKEIAMNIRESRKFKQEFFLPMLQKIEAYIHRQGESGKPLTISGLIIASGVTKSSFYEMKDGKYDYALYQYADYEGVDLENDIVDEYCGLPYHVNSKDIAVLLAPASEVIERAMLLQAEETETRLYEKGRVGDIFTMKAQHGWQEEEKHQVTNNTLVIASEGESQRALQRLLGSSE